MKLIIDDVALFYVATRGVERQMQAPVTIQNFREGILCVLLLLLALLFS